MILRCRVCPGFGNSVENWRAYEKLEAAEADEHAGQQQLAEQDNGEHVLHVVQVLYERVMLPHTILQLSDRRLSETLHREILRLTRSGSSI